MSAPEPEVDGRPELRLAEEDREATADIIAEILLAALEQPTVRRVGLAP